jgi:protein ImuB
MPPLTKRIAVLWLPHFAINRRTRPGKDLAELRDVPLAIVARGKGGMRIAAANNAARQARVMPGLNAADAKAICPHLRTIAEDSAADSTALAALAEWCQRWSPWTAPGESGIHIDTTGCAHLFGGERAMLDDMVAKIEGLGFTIRAGLADTLGAAWAVAHFGGDTANLLPEGAARQMLTGFPVAALRLPPETVATLRRLGLRRLSELMALPRAPLAARFGNGVAQRLDQLLGRLPEPLSPLTYDEPLFARLAFAEPIGRTEDVAAAILHLLGDLEKIMERRGLGARRLVLRLFRVDGDTTARIIGTAAPVRAAAPLARLFADELNGLDAGFGIESLTLTVAAADSMKAAQTDMESGRQGIGLPPLIDRLTRRLGPRAVYRIGAHPTAQPEKLCAKLPPLVAPPPLVPPRPRPLRLSRPVPVTMDSTLYRITGPERIAPEWWHPGTAAARDYWQVEDQHGRRWWVFQDTDDGRWFKHGEFG